MTRTSLAPLGERAMDGEPLTSEEACTLAQGGPERLMELIHWASRIRSRFFGRKVSFCCISRGRLGGCDQDCAWCGQSARHAPAAPPPQRHNCGQLLEEARKARRSCASCFCVVNPGRQPTEGDLRSLEELNHTLEAEGLPPACASLGELGEAVAHRLRAAWVVRYNHNLETSRSHFGRIVTTHNDDRLSTLRAARSAGMALCCGGIFGIGETWADRLELALTLREQVKPDVLPLNFLDARPGPPLASATPLTPLECLHIIAVFRFLLPTTNIKVAGGRRLLRDLQSWVFHAGATSLMVGDYLTTAGRSVKQDRQMVLDLGLELTEGPCDGECNDRRQA